MKIGYQLYSALSKCGDAEGLKNVIKHIAEMGYDGVEFFLYQGIPAEEMKELLDSCGIVAFNSHVQLERLYNDAAFEVDYAKKLGMEAITIPYIAPEDRNEETFSKMIGMIPVWGKLCEDAGIRLCYHNHDFEFEKSGEVLLLERIMDSYDRLLLEPDTFWIHYAGYDPSEILEKYKDRISFIHVKDYTDLNKGDFPKFTAIGTGKMDNVPVAKKASDIGVKWAVVEQDNSAIDELESAEISVKAMKKLFS